MPTRQNNSITALIIVVALVFMSYAQAGTAGITGVYSGDYQFIAFAHNIPQGTDAHGTIFTATSPANYMGQANARQTWNWDFDAGIASFEAGQHMLTIGVPYTLHNANSIAITDHGDGTYSGDLDFQVFNPAFGNPRSMITITWEITDDGMGGLTMATFDADGNGFVGTVPGCDHLRDLSCTDSVSWGGFPFPFEPTWDGDGQVVSTGTLALSEASYSVTEDTASITVAVNRSGGSFGAISVDYEAVSGVSGTAATAGVDFQSSSGTINFADGITTPQTFDITITNDTNYEGDETFNLILSNAQNASLGTPASAVVTIVEDDSIPPSGVLQFAETTYSVNEHGVSVLLSVNRTGGNFGTVSVDYASSDGSATSGADYQAVSGTLEFLDGEIEKTLSIAITDDVIYEGDEDFSVSLNNVTGGATLGSTASTTVSIIENEPPAGELQFSTAGYTVGEEVSTVSVTVSRINGSYGAISVAYVSADETATAGSDYQAISGTLNFTDGSNVAQTFDVSIVNDTIYEDDETFRLNLSNVQGGASLGTQNSTIVTIVEDDPIPLAGVLQFRAAQDSVDENRTSIQLTVVRTSGDFGYASVDYTSSDGSATLGADYQTTMGTLEFFTGETEKTVSISIIDDDIYEGDENFSVSLSNVSGAVIGAISNTIVTIIENEPPAGVLQFRAIVYWVTEGDDAEAVLTLSRINGSWGEIQVAYEAVAGTADETDYANTSGTITFASGETSKTLSINIIDDNVIENLESFTVKLLNSVGTVITDQSETSIKILDNDAIPDTGTIPNNDSDNENSGLFTGTLSIPGLLFLLMYSLYSIKMKR